MKKQIWYLHSGKKYPEDDPRYFNPEESSWAVDIEKHWVELKGEIKTLINEKDKNFQSASYLGLTSNEGWSSLSYLFLGSRIKNANLSASCPKLAVYLNKIPGLVSVSFSRLSPNTTIGEHSGDSNVALRCHLGIEVPAGLPQCGIQVGGEQRTWQEGKWLFFNDAWNHFAWNKTDRRRIVLIVDVIRPEFLPEMKQICANIRTMHILIHLRGQYKFLGKLPRWAEKILFSGMYVAVYTVKLIRPSNLK